jgi:hypothetical protein
VILISHDLCLTGLTYGSRKRAEKGQLARQIIGASAYPADESPPNRESNSKDRRLDRSLVAFRRAIHMPRRLPGAGIGRGFSHGSGEFIRLLGHEAH